MVPELLAVRNTLRSPGFEEELEELERGQAPKNEEGAGRQWLM
jgi:hypothetical protein